MVNIGFGEHVNSLAIALPIERLFNFPQHESDNQDTRNKVGHVKPSEERRLTAPVQPGVQVPASHKVQLSGMDLRQREAGDTDVKQLMARSHKGTPTQTAALQRRNREEEGGAEGQRHLAKVIDRGGVVAVWGEHQPPGDGGLMSQINASADGTSWPTLYNTQA